jgi:hypothetical protein
MCISLIMNIDTFLRTVNMNPVTFSRFIGVKSRTTIQRYLAGTRKPRPGVIRAMRQASFGYIAGPTTEKGKRLECLYEILNTLETDEDRWFFQSDFYRSLLALVDRSNQFAPHDFCANAVYTLIVYGVKYDPLGEDEDPGIVGHVSADMQAHLQCLLYQALEMDDEEEAFHIVCCHKDLIYDHGTYEPLKPQVPETYMEQAMIETAPLYTYHRGNYYNSRRKLVSPVEIIRKANKARKRYNLPLFIYPGL